MPQQRGHVHALRAAFMQANHASGAGALIQIPEGTYALTVSATGCRE